MEKRNRKKDTDTKPLKGQEICISHIEGEELDKLIQKIESNGGTYNENLSLRTNILISDNVSSLKSTLALDKGIDILTKEWLFNLTPSNSLNKTEYKIKCFHGVDIFLFGFNKETADQITKTIVSNNGTVLTKPNKSAITICYSSLFLPDKERKAMEHSCLKVVTEKWYEHCISNSRYYPPRKEFELSNDIIISKYDLLFNSIDNDDFYMSNKSLISQLFLGKNFYLINFPQKSKIALIKTISKCGGMIYNFLSPNIHYILCTFKNDVLSLREELNEYNINYTPHILTYEFVFDSIYNLKIEDVSKYKAPLSFNQTLEEIDSSRKGKKRHVITSNIFKGETFAIYPKTYSPEDENEIKDKIIENSGTIIDIDVSKESKVKFIIFGDGYDKLLTDLLNYMESTFENNAPFCVVSHRFVDFCIEEKKIVNLLNYFHLVPFRFKPPYKKIVEQNMEFYIYNKEMKLSDRQPLEMLIETLGGNIDQSKYTTFVVVVNKISKSDFKKIKQKTNPNIKAILYEWFIDLLLSADGQLPDPDNYRPEFTDD